MTLERKTGLRRDTEKAREFAQRGRGTLSANVDTTRAFVQRGREAAAKSLRASGPKGPAQTPKESQRPRFKAKTPARECTCSKDGCEKTATSHHHWLPQTQIRAYIDTLRIRNDHERKRRTEALLNDPRNYSPFCRGHHGDHGTAAHEFDIAEVPQSAYEFARDLGTEWLARLVRTYSPR